MRKSALDRWSLMPTRQDYHKLLLCDFSLQATGVAVSLLTPSPWSQVKAVTTRVVYSKIFFLSVRILWKDKFETTRETCPCQTSNLLVSIRMDSRLSNYMQWLKSITIIYFDI